MYEFIKKKKIALIINYVTNQQVAKLRQWCCTRRPVRRWCRAEAPCSSVVSRPESRLREPSGRASAADRSPATWKNSTAEWSASTKSKAPKPVSTCARPSTKQEAPPEWPRSTSRAFRRCPSRRRGAPFESDSDSGCISNAAQLVIPCRPCPGSDSAPDSSSTRSMWPKPSRWIVFPRLKKKTKKHIQS